MDNQDNAQSSEPNNPVNQPQVIQPTIGQQPPQTYTENNGQQPYQPNPANQPQDQQPQRQDVTDVLGILSIVFAFVISIVGLILGIVGIIKAKKRGYSPVLSVIGTILSLVVIAFILAIVFFSAISTYQSIQSKAADTDRQTDAKSIASQLEVYYANYGSYPALAQLQDTTWIQKNLKGLSPDSIIVLNGDGTNAISNVASTTTYQYEPTPAGCTTAKRDCTAFTLTVDQETQGAAPIVKQSTYGQ